MALRPCLGGLDGTRCTRLAEGPRCPEHQREYNRRRWARQDANRPNSSRRGLGGEHRAQVRALLAAYIAEHGHPPTHCPRCGQPFTPRNPATGEHGIPRARGGSAVTEIICRSCNSAGGAAARRPPDHGGR